jgi:hypothetical protein
MKSGGHAALLIAGIGLAGCAAGPKPVEVRAIADPAAAIRGGDDLAVARGLLRLGNVGLALEAFRKVQRDRPSDPAALAGIGDCYSAMGRLDLAQSSYEAALALAPKSPSLLNGLAQVLEREGQGARAVAVRVEAAIAAMPVVLASSVQAAGIEPATRPERATAPKEPLSIGSITVSLPPPQRADHLQAGSAALHERMPGFDVAPSSSSIASALPPPSAALARASAPKDSLPTGSITVRLPPVRPADRLQAGSAGLRQRMPGFDVAPPSSSVAVALLPVAPASAARRAVARQAAAAPLSGPRLERLSPGEVALVTSGRSLWLARPGVRVASTSVRWVPLARSGATPNVQVLNAARSRGLAASARAVLIDRGWRKIAIGDAARAQQESVVLYPKERAGLARSLAAQFGIGTRMVEGDRLVLVLGRDKAQQIKGRRG